MVYTINYVYLVSNSNIFYSDLITDKLFVLQKITLSIVPIIDIHTSYRTDYCAIITCSCSDVDISNRYT